MKNSERLYPLKEYRRYSISHVQKQFKNLYGIEIMLVNLGYKGYRYKRFKLYDMYSIETGKLMATNLTLAVLGNFLVSQGDY